MKKLVHIVIITIIVSFLFPSCARKMSIAKRKYTKGYYIARTGKKSDVKTKDLVINTKETDQKDIASASKAEITQPRNQNELIAESAAEQAASMSQEQTNRSKQSVDRKERFVYNTFAQSLEKLQKLERITGNKKLSSKIQTKMKSNDAVGDVLSLFWVVILILLLLYLIGLLFDGFGLGWAIHILALIVLIFLVLWLLRVV
ncbi:MAG TPA: hypothetical protein VGF30_12890 [Bacteroidia bacterium]